MATTARDRVLIVGGGFGGASRWGRTALPDRPEVFAIGDMVALDGVPSAGRSAMRRERRAGVVLPPSNGAR